MSKKKPEKKIQQLSPENYIRQKGRNLTIAECFITPGWEEVGECNILVARKHVSGNYTVGFYLVDTYCLGVKDAGYRYNLSENEYAELKEDLGDNFEPTSYEEVHNIIYGALEYAEDLGFRPHKDFAVAQYLLEEDTDDIPYIEYEFGCNGRPNLVVDTLAEFNRYAPTLRKAVGNDFDFYIAEEDDYEDDEDDDYEDDEDEELTAENEVIKKIIKKFDKLSEEKKSMIISGMGNFIKRIEKSKSLPQTTYNYQHPEYPQTLDLTHKELNILFLPEYNEELEKETVDKILSLPRKTLIKDLENCILYEIGQNCEDISVRNQNEDSYGLFAHSMQLLADMKSTESLPVILEIMRQNQAFYEFFFGDFAHKIFNPVLYELAKNQLSVLLSYAKEPGLYPFFRILVSPVVEMVVKKEPERRPEVIAWYGELLDFLNEKINDTAYYDANFAGMLMNEPMNIHAKELLPKIKRLYETGLVNEIACGDYNDVEKVICQK